MTEKEALRLLDMVELYLGPDRAKLHQIGNGEWTVLLLTEARRDLDYFLWSMSDWRAWQHEHPRGAKQERRVPINRRLVIVQRAIDSGQPCAVHLPVSI
jgi:hypothetical protein